MAATASVRVVFNRFPELQGRARQRGGQIAQQTADAVVELAKGFAPVLTGRLRDSIEAVKVGPYRWSVQTDVEYAPYQEYGTWKMPPHPFMTPAAELARPILEDAAHHLLDE